MLAKPQQIFFRIAQPTAIDLLVMLAQQGGRIPYSPPITRSLIGAKRSAEVGELAGLWMRDLLKETTDFELLDLDHAVYGVENCRKAYAALEALVKKEASRFKPYTRQELQTLFEFRSKDTIMSFEDFARVEDRKAFQGRFLDADYFVRFVKGWNEISEKYGDVCYKNTGYARITATVADDSEALFTPCTYRLENVKVLDGPALQPITEVVSFRGRFCEQAKTGETIAAQGKVEHVTETKGKSEHYRLIIGNKPQDYMSLSHD